MSKEFLDIDIFTQLPQSLNNDKDIVGLFKEIDNELKEIVKKRKYLYLIANIDILPEKIIELLAWQWHVDFWDVDLSLDRKRTLVKNSIRWHCIKGTPAAVEEVVQESYGNCKLQEWFEYGGKPYCFKVAVKLEEESTDKNRWKNVLAAIESAKNVRSWLEKIEFYYPDIILPLKIQHQAEFTQIVDANHNVWNLGAVKFVRRDGIYYRNKLTRRNGIQPDGGYRTKQNHRAEIDLLVDSTLENNGQVINFRDNKYSRNGSHRRKGIYREKYIVSNYCTVSYIKNGVEVTECV